MADRERAAGAKVKECGQRDSVIRYQDHHISACVENVMDS